MSFHVDSPGTVLISTLLDILALDILGLDILGLDILGLDILGRFHRKDADRSPEDAGFKGGKELYQSGYPEHEDDCSLGEVLQGSRNIVYEAKDDTTGVSFEKNGVKEWVPIVVTNYGKELGVKEMERCKKIVYFQSENGPQFSIRKGKCQFPTPIARRTRSRLKSETP